MQLTRKQYEDIYNHVYNYPTKNAAGFIKEEKKELLSHYPDINLDKFYDAMMGNTCMLSPEGQTIMYHCDIYKALICGLENRNLRVEEWD